MTGKERLDSCMSLANSSADSFDRRRQYEWKMTIAYWAVIVASFNPSFKTLDVDDNVWWLSAVIFVVIWLRGVWIAHHNDKDRYEYFREAAEKLLSDPQMEVRPFDRKIKPYSLRGLFGFLWNWSIFWQALVTIGLVAVRTSTEMTLGTNG